MYFFKHLVSEMRLRHDMHRGHFRNRSLSKRIEVEKGKVFFLTLNDSFSCNPKYIYLEMVKQGIGRRYLWATTEEHIRKGDFPQGIELVDYRSGDFFRKPMSSKVVIQNAHVRQIEDFRGLEL